MNKIEIRKKQDQHDKDKKAYNYRMVLLLSNADLETIDEWRYANRCSTRSEAIRKLMNLGLQVEGVKKND